MRVPQSFRTSARAAVLLAVAGVSVFGLSPVHAQTPGREPGPARERQLSLTEAVGLALEQNLDLQVERVNPQLQELGISVARANWTPTFSTTYTGLNQSTQPNNLLVGGITKVTTNQNGINVALQSLTKWGGFYNVGFNNLRGTTNNIFSLFNPQLNSTFQAQYQQPLLRNFSIDQTRQQLLVTQQEPRDLRRHAAPGGGADHAQRKNAYWDWSCARDNLTCSAQSLELAERRSRRIAHASRSARWRRSTSSRPRPRSRNAKRRSSWPRPPSTAPRTACARSIFGRTRSSTNGTCASSRATPATFVPVQVDIDGAVRGAMDQRTDLEAGRKTVESNDVTVRYLVNQTKPDLLANVSYNAAAVGGTGAIRGDGFPGPSSAPSSGRGATCSSDVFAARSRPGTSRCSSVTRSATPAPRRCWRGPACRPRRPRSSSTRCASVSPPRCATPAAPSTPTASASRPPGPRGR